MGVGLVGVERDCDAVLGDRLIELSLAVEDEAEVVMGYGVSGLSRMAVSPSAMASSSFPWPARAIAR